MRPVVGFVVFAPALVVASCALAGANGNGGSGGGSASSSSGTSGNGGASSTHGSTTATTSSAGGSGGSGGAGGVKAGSGGAGGVAGTGGASASTGSGTCTPADPTTVCCPIAACGSGMKCCQNMGTVGCQNPMCQANQHFNCDDSRDCMMGQLCCAHWNGTHYDSDVTCMPAMTPTTCPGGDTEICDTSNPHCADGGQCSAASQLGGGNHGYCL